MCRTPHSLRGHAACGSVQPWSFLSALQLISSDSAVIMHRPGFFVCQVAITVAAPTIAVVAVFDHAAGIKPRRFKFRAKRTQRPFDKVALIGLDCSRASTVLCLRPMRHLHQTVVRDRSWSPPSARSAYDRSCVGLAGAAREIRTSK